jgi:hypothetical protein
MIFVPTALQRIQVALGYKLPTSSDELIASLWPVFDAMQDLRQLGADIIGYASHYAEMLEAKEAPDQTEAARLIDNFAWHVRAVHDQALSRVIACYFGDHIHDDGDPEAVQVLENFATGADRLLLSPLEEKTKFVRNLGLTEDYLFWDFSERLEKIYQIQDEQRKALKKEEQG